MAVERAILSALSQDEARDLAERLEALALKIADPLEAEETMPETRA